MPEAKATENAFHEMTEMSQPSSASEKEIEYEDTKL